MARLRKSLVDQSKTAGNATDRRGPQQHRGREASVAIFGDTSGILTSHHKGKRQLLQGGSDEIYGDAYVIEDAAKGGNDELIANGGLPPNHQYYSLYGDAYVMRDHSIGGNDVLTGGEATGNQLIGDSYFMSGSAVGGNDRLTGG